MDERKAQRILARFFEARGAVITTTNLYFPEFEADFLAIDRDDMITEVEIKVSKWDYLNDIKKETKHNYLESRSDWSKIPCQFFYAVPRDISHEIKLPPYAGLILLDKDRAFINIPAKMLRTDSLSREEWKRLAIKLSNK